MTEFSAVTEKTVLDGTELMLGASSGDETSPQKFSVPAVNVYNGFVNVLDHGAVGDGVTDDLAAIDLAIAESASTGMPLFFPVSLLGFRTSATVAIPNGVSVVMDGILIKTDAGGPIMTIGTLGSRNDARYLRYYLRVEYDIPGNASGDWATSDNCCIEFISLHKCSDVYIAATNGGHTGVRFAPVTSQESVGYNNIEMGFLRSHKMAVEIFLTQDGWFNQNRVTLSSANVASGVSPGIDRYGLYIHTDGVLDDANRCNGNSFHGFGAELNPPGLERAIPFYLFNSTANRFHDFRGESNDGQFLAYIDGPSCRDNIFTTVGSESASENLIDIGPELGTNPPGIVTTAGSAADSFTTIFDSGHLPDLVAFLDGDISIARFGWSLSGSPYTKSRAGAVQAIPPDYVEMTSAYGLALRVDFVVGVKHIRVSTVSPTSQQGRLFVQVYDSADNIIDNTGTLQPVSFGSWITSHGGSWIRGVDSTAPVTYDDLYFLGPNSAGETEVAYALLIWGGSATHPQISSIEVKALADSIITVSAPVDNYLFHDKGRVGDTVPLEGTFNAGDTIRNVVPTPGGYASWVCQTGGVPGTWLGAGVIEIP